MNLQRRARSPSPMHPNSDPETKNKNKDYSNSANLRIRAKNKTQERKNARTQGRKTAISGSLSSAAIERQRSPRPSLSACLSEMPRAARRSRRYRFKLCSS